MSNFEYIIASLPFLTLDYRYAEGSGFEKVLEEIRRDLSERDLALLEDLLKGFDGAQLDASFYACMLRHKNRFLREYFRFDLNLRNAKVRYLNAQLGRDPGQDLLTGKGSEDDDPGELDIDLNRFTGGEFEEGGKVDQALAESDLIARERNLDELVWAKIDALATFHYFDMSAVLAYVTKLHIVDRWLSLDEAAGRELFHKLVKEVKRTFKGVKYEEK